ncbi:hypothetical protein KSP39_PZI023744 [Platanthera zijinensis]|uniref:Uncharacterized protein n=1 Tax=Platanthera zijinensis TaxID=2320716 RepID=A0AAP0AT72_9ASPA
MVAAGMIWSGARQAEAAKLAISWPKFDWCFPDCIIGETCFFHVWRYCKRILPNVTLFNCIVIAIEWCDIEIRFDVNKVLYMPPSPPQPALLS